MKQFLSKSPHDDSVLGKVVIACWLSTIENADKIVVLEQGKIVEQGSPEELLKNPDSYFARHHKK